MRKAREGQGRQGKAKEGRGRPKKAGEGQGRQGKAKEGKGRPRKAKERQSITHAGVATAVTSSRQTSSIFKTTQVAGSQYG